MFKNRVQKLERRIENLTRGNQNLRNQLNETTAKNENLQTQIDFLKQVQKIYPTTPPTSTTTSNSQKHNTTQTINITSPQTNMKLPASDEDESLENEKTETEILNDLMGKIEDENFNYEELKTINWENISLPIPLLKEPVAEIIKKD